MPIECDPAKSASNVRKHGLSFEMAAEFLASGIDFVEIHDEEHSDDEDRFIAVGPIAGGVIVVVYTERDDDVLRIISARMATKNERGHYEEYEKARRRR